MQLRNKIQGKKKPGTHWRMEWNAFGYEWQTHSHTHTNANKKFTKISLITMYGFILFYVRMKQISVASGTVMVDREEWNDNKKNRINKNGWHWSHTVNRLALRYNSKFQMIHFGTLRVFFSCILIFYWAFVVFFYSQQSCWLVLFFCHFFLFIHFWQILCVFVCCFDVQLRHCFEPITKFMWK